MIHSYVLVLSAATREGNIPRIGQMGKPCCFFDMKELMAMKTMAAITISRIWMSCKREKQREKKFPVAAAMSERREEEEVRLRVLGLLLVMVLE